MRLYRTSFMKFNFPNYGKRWRYGFIFLYLYSLGCKLPRLMNGWSESIFQNHCARMISRAKERIILRFKNINCQHGASWWIHESKAAYCATSFSLNTLASTCEDLEDLTDHKFSLQYRQISRHLLEEKELNLPLLTNP